MIVEPVVGRFLDADGLVLDHLSSLPSSMLGIGCGARYELCFVAFDAVLHSARMNACGNLTNASGLPNKPL